MTTPSGLTPDGSTPQGATWGDYAEKTEADWKAEQTASWELSIDPLALVGGFLQSLPTTIITTALGWLADALDMVPIVGSTLSDIVDNIAAGLNGTNTTAIDAGTTAGTAQTTADGVGTALTGAFHTLATLLDMVPFVGSTLSDFVENIADGMNLVNTTAITADSTATTAQSTATTAQSTATTASTAATAAQTTANAAQTGVTSIGAAAVTTTVINGQTVSRSVYTSNGTWTKPTPAAGKQISRIAAAAINGGTGGNGPINGPGGGSEGGQGGGYTYKEFATGSVSSSITVTVGAGGAGGGNGAAGTTGGASSFGSLVVGLAGVANVLTAQGAIGSTCAPGSGGNGGNGWVADGGTTNPLDTATAAGFRGGSSALAVGGAGGAAGGTGYGNGGNGSAGGTTGTDTQIYSGGAGGGGGGGTSAYSGAFGGSNGPGSGGAGSAPGGGGGGAGGGRNNAGSRPGGSGANGAVIVWTYFEDIP